MKLDLAGKTALVTGGSIGIGLAVSRALAAEGVNIVMCARNDVRLADEARSIQQQLGVETLGIQADVSNADDVQRLVNTVVETCGGIDILINNAGVGSKETIQEAPDEKWQYYWDLFVMAAVRLARGLIPSMKERGGGVIIHNASICAKQPLGYEPIYNTTKAALAMFSKCLANEVIKDNIRVNTINPGLILTPDWYNTATLLTENTDKTPDSYLEDLAKEHAPIGRFASPEELANFFVFLCSPRASYCVGSTYYVDGGWLKTVE